MVEPDRQLLAVDPTKSSEYVYGSILAIAVPFSPRASIVILEDLQWLSGRFELVGPDCRFNHDDRPAATTTVERNALSTAAVVRR